MTKRILVPLASGSEEIEAVTVIDMMVRAGYEVVTASADPDGALTLTASRGVKITADCLLVDVADEEFDAVVLSGGLQGAQTFRDSTVLIEIVRQQMYDHKLVAAICAAPAVVLQHHQLYPQAIMTGHPNFKDQIPASHWRNKRVTYDVNHHLITSQGPGSAIEFGLEIIRTLSGTQLAQEVVLPMVPLPQLHYEKLGDSDV